MKKTNQRENQQDLRQDRATTAEANSEAQSTAGSSRRIFLTRIWMGLGILALVEMAWVVAAFLRPRSADKRSRGPGAAVIEAGPVERFPLNSVTAFARGKFYLARLEDGGFLALSRKCTHLGCTVPWSSEDKQFACPCHSSAFDIRGDVIHPPAPRALDLYRVFIENRIVKVDTQNQIRRSAFRPEQVVHAERA